MEAVCTFCGNVCDDVEFDVEKQKGKRFCPLGLSKVPKERENKVTND